MSPSTNEFKSQDSSLVLSVMSECLFWGTLMSQQRDGNAQRPASLIITLIHNDGTSLQQKYYNVAVGRNHGDNIPPAS